MLAGGLTARDVGCGRDWVPRSFQDLSGGSSPCCRHIMAPMRPIRESPCRLAADQRPFTTTTVQLQSTVMHESHDGYRGLDGHGTCCAVPGAGRTSEPLNPLLTELNCSFFNL